MAATNLAEISEHIKKMHFRRKWFGGVDEEDVWKQIRELDADYRNLFKIQNQICKMEIARAKSAAKKAQIAPEPEKEDAKARKKTKADREKKVRKPGT